MVGINIEGGFSNSMAQSSLYKTVVIPAGANAVSTDVPYGQSLRGLVTPSTFEGTSITFEVAQEAGGPFVPLYDNATLYSVTSNVSRFIAIDKPHIFIGHRYLKIINNVSGSPSNVAAARTVGQLYGSE